MRPPRAWRAGPLALITGTAVAAIAGYPLADLFLQSFFEAGHASFTAYQRLFDGATSAALGNTLIVAAVAALIAEVIGTLAALLVQRSDLPARAAIGLAMQLPLLTPPFIQAVSWLDAYARGGLTYQWWGLAAGWLESAAGVTALLAVQASPIVFLLVSAQLASDRGAELEQAARAAGAGQWRALLDITLPRLAPALLASALIGAISSAADFGVPAVLGIPAGFTVVTTLIYRRMSLSGGPEAFADMVALSALLTLVALIVVGAAAVLGRMAVRHAPSTQSGHGGHQIRLGVFRWPLALVSGFLLLGVAGLPLFALVLKSLAPAFQPSVSPRSWTSAHFASALAHGGIDSLAHSAALAVVAGLLVAGAGVAIAIAERRAGWLGRGSAALASLPFALPGSVVAVAAILAWQRWLYGTFVIMLLAYLARFSLLGVRAAVAGIATLPEDLSEAAHGAGAGGWRTLFDVQRPLMQPALLAGLGITFLFVIHELTISSLLYTPQTETIAVQVLNSQQAGDLASTSALSVLILGVTLLAAVPLACSGRIRRLIGAELGG